MAPTTAQDDLKLLYAYIKLTPAKPKMSDVAAFMGLKDGATAWRFQALMKRIEKETGTIDGSPAGGTCNSGSGATKRKRVAKGTGRGEVKRVKRENGGATGSEVGKQDCEDSDEAGSQAVKEEMEEVNGA